MNIQNQLNKNSNQSRKLKFQDILNNINQLKVRLTKILQQIITLMDERVKQLEKDIVNNEVEQQDNRQFQQNETIYFSDFNNLKELLSHFQNTMSELQNAFGEIQILTKSQNIEVAIQIQQVGMDQKEEREMSKQSQLNLQENIKITNLQLQLLEQHQSEQLLKIQNQALINQIQQLSKQVQSLEYQQKEQSQVKEGMRVMMKFKYEQINQNNPVKQQEFCGALAFNADCSILVIGCNKTIKIFDFDQGVLKLIQILTGHSNLIQTLNFMRNNNQQFVSGSSDNQIFVWKQQQDCKWICQQKLQGHTSGIICLILNGSDDLMVSGSKDKTIKFWLKPNKDADWICSQTNSEHQDYVNAISMNENELKVISCGEDKLILVFERPSKLQDQWNIIQRIRLQNMGFRLCFISDDQFTFQPCKQSYMSVFELDNNNIYKLKTEVAVKGGNDDCYNLFPQQFNKSKNVLINKNVSNINFIRKNQNGDLVTEQSIDFCTSSMNGQLSNDGEYLATWDRKSWEIQIRKYQVF